MKIEQIEAFVYVALTGSFSKAGEILFLSQPSVSARVKSLENELGSTLFNRVGKNIILSKSGENFLPYAKEILHNVQSGKLAIQKENNKTEGKLVISSVLIAAYYILPQLFEKFQKAYPKVRLVIHTGHSHHVLEQVLNYEVPIGISRAVNHPLIETTHLMDDEMVLVIYPDHHFSSRKTVSIEEVAREPLILFNRSTYDWSLTYGVFKNLNIEPNVVMEVDSIEVIKRMVKKQVGIALLPRFSINEELAKNQLLKVNVLNIPQLNRNFELIHLKGATFEGIEKLFIDFIVNYFNRKSTNFYL
ncbi:LysR family transcriptional regulator [Microaerobacter geothermalis]|uniref:LysR family transcriptional regulator n=1 Tax=Microaerobacter geothermalis TaxID=674972 RepID=UPI001F378438|nr:LysR family transcriptional regulator [Microaerobacter geothermalis]MCF6093680.1 LysR family transcriptional regulator [Microaerobacter geothermalis]